MRSCSAISKQQVGITALNVPAAELHNRKPNAALVQPGFSIEGLSDRNKAQLLNRQGLRYSLGRRGSRVHGFRGHGFWV